MVWQRHHTSSEPPKGLKLRLAAGVIPVFAGRLAGEFLEGRIEELCVVKPTVYGNIGDNAVRGREHLTGGVDADSLQHAGHGFPRDPLEEAPEVFLAEIVAGGQLVDADGFHVVLMKMVDHLVYDALLAGRAAAGGAAFLFPGQQHQQFNDIGADQGCIALFLSVIFVVYPVKKSLDLRKIVVGVAHVVAAEIVLREGIKQEGRGEDVAQCPGNHRRG